MTPTLALILGGGELGTGVGHALHGAGLRLLVIDRPLPGALRLGVTFAIAAVTGRHVVQDVEAVHCTQLSDVEQAWQLDQVPVWTAEEQPLPWRPRVLVDSRMRQLTAPQQHRDTVEVSIGIGPGFEAGSDVHYVIESNRGPRLGRVLTAGKSEAHSGIPGDVAGFREERILRAPCAGRFVRQRTLGDWVEPDDVVGHVAGEPVRARLQGMIRGLKLSGVMVGERHKVGDVDPRRDPTLLQTMTDKARAVGRGALQALATAGILPATSSKPDVD